MKYIIGRSFYSRGVMYAAGDVVELDKEQGARFAAYLRPAVADEAPASSAPRDDGRRNKMLANSIKKGKRQ